MLHQIAAFLDLNYKQTNSKSLTPKFHTYKGNKDHRDNNGGLHVTMVMKATNLRTKSHGHISAFKVNVLHSTALKTLVYPLNSTFEYKREAYRIQRF